MTIVNVLGELRLVFVKILSNEVKYSGKIGEKKCLAQGYNKSIEKTPHFSSVSMFLRERKSR